MRKELKPKHLRTIQGTPKAGEPGWSVYVLRCGDGTLYTGIAKDVQLRLKKHSAGKASAYTRAHLPVTLLYQQPGFTRSEALVREAQIKSLPRQKKEILINGKMTDIARIKVRNGRRVRRNFTDEEKRFKPNPWD